jgi:hypothetical protein
MVISQSFRSFHIEEPFSAFLQTKHSLLQWQKRSKLIVYTIGSWALRFKS